LTVIASKLKDKFSTLHLLLESASRRMQIHRDAKLFELKMSNLSKAGVNAMNLQMAFSINIWPGICGDSELWSRRAGEEAKFRRESWPALEPRNTSIPADTLCRDFPDNPMSCQVEEGSQCFCSFQ
jgi:hypothetical protein